MKITPMKEANARDIKISSAPTVRHHIIKKGFKPVKAKPMKKRWRKDDFLNFDSLGLDRAEFWIWTIPKTIRNIPPIIPTTS